MKNYSMLYGWANPEINHQCTQETFRLLKEQDVTLITRKPMPIVEYKKEWFTVTDNGGELNIEKVNFPEGMRSIPYTHTDRALDTMTMCYRILKALRGESIDYTWFADEGAKIYTAV